MSAAQEVGIDQLDVIGVAQYTLISIQLLIRLILGLPDSEIGVEYAVKQVSRNITFLFFQRTRNNCFVRTLEYDTSVFRFRHRYDKYGQNNNYLVKHTHDDLNINDVQHTD